MAALFDVEPPRLDRVELRPLVELLGGQKLEQVVGVRPAKKAAEPKG